MAIMASGSRADEERGERVEVVGKNKEKWLK